MAMDRNYLRLAQMMFHKHSAAAITNDMLKNGAIDYQIPVNSIEDPEYKKLEGCTALHILVQNSNIQDVKRLLENGADCTLKNSIGETALHQATYKIYSTEVTKDQLDPSMINEILGAHLKFNIIQNPLDTNGLSHLHIACIVNHKDAVKFFLENGSSVNTPIDIKSPFMPGYTPLHLAAKYSGLITFKTLLDHGAHVALESADGLNPLHTLIQQNIKMAYKMETEERALYNYEKLNLQKNEVMIHLLLEKYVGKKNDLLKDTGLSFLHVLCTLRMKFYITEQFFARNHVDLQYSVKADSPVFAGYTALHFAAQLNNKNAKMLVKHGANVMAKDAKGITPFDLCLKTYKAEDLHFIVENQQDWKDIVLTDGETSLQDLLHAMRSEESLSIFVQRVGANASIHVNSPLWPGYTPLHLAIALAKRVEGNQVHTLHLERIRILLDAGADVNATDSCGSTPVHIAFGLHKSKVIDLLLQTSETSQSISDLVDKDNVSHLHIACAADKLLTVQEMLKASDANVNLPLKVNCKFDKTSEDVTTSYLFVEGSTPLHIAVITRSIMMTWLLYKAGADVHAKDAEGLTPIHRVFGSDYSPDVSHIGRTLFLESNLKDVVTDFGLSHLHVACWVGDELAVRRLLRLGVDVNVRLKHASKPEATDESARQLQFSSDYEFCSPLELALRRKQSDVMDFIFQREKYFMGRPTDVLKASRYTKNSSSFDNFKKTHGSLLDTWGSVGGIAMLHVACYQCDVAAVELLLKQGADPNARVLSKSASWPCLTPLHVLMDSPFAKQRKINAIAQLLIDYGADVTVANPKGATVINEIMDDRSFKRKQTAILLLNGQKNFAINPGAVGQRISHFHAACILNAASVVERFLKHGVDVNQSVHPVASSYGGCTPLHLAALFNAKETVALLLEYAARVHSQNGEGNTALHCAAICNKTLTGDRGVCELLIMSLIGAGAEVNTTNIYGETPLEVLLKTHKPTGELLRVLSRNPGRVNIFNDHNGTGFIATAIKRQTNVKDIIEHPVYRSVIYSPGINAEDDQGRTPIHNIVAISKIAASVQVYTKAIEGYLKVGFDIDQQNKKDQTALHVAVYFRNSIAVAALLTLGANINVFSDGETPFSFHWKHHGSSCSDMTRLLENDRQIITSFAKHVYKCQLIKFHVSKSDQAVEAELKTRRWNMDLKVIEQWIVELERLETEKISRSNISWWSLLSETGVIASFPTMRQAERQDICDVFEKRSFHLRKEFPELAGILHMQYRKAVARVPLIDPSKYALASMTNFNLPDLCSERVLRFLKNADLVNLIDANENHVIHKRKRRRILVDDAL